MTRPVLITGASRGLGAALAEAIAPKFHIIAVAKTTGGLEELDDRIQAKGGQATLAPMDVTNADAMAHLCKSIFDRWGGLSWWFHTAIHAAPLSPADYINAKDFQKSLALNMTATSALIPCVAPLLTNGGNAVFFDDPKHGQKFFGAYGATKAGQISLAQAWQAESGPSGPKVHIVTPPPMPTAIRARFHPGEDRDILTSCDAAATLILSDLGVV